ncbi:MAG: DNA primase [Verrucomicrobia bacterium]|nr:DNA primase [Verrucomicrobiota bacterium]MBU4429241.1 DNA primase [Verrucomicrobiota bacterium]MCG2680370.1 DNA primase [Kiritimatiellia bacterium]
MSPIVSQSVLEEIRLHSDIAAVIGAYFNLRRSGATFKALCPFHKEKTPSFTVNPQRQIYHCFGCGAGGDVFRFIMEYEKVDFMMAVKMLAQRAGIRLAFDEQGRGDGSAKDILYTINDKVAHLYHQYLLKSPEGQKARDYLKARDLSDSIAERFLIGFAPNRWDTVLEWAKKNYRREHLQALGLILTAAARDGAEQAAAEPTHWYDRFRNRLMFPIHDEQGRVVGFSGRIMDAGDVKSAKYVNSPETPLFHKGRVLYALHKARRAIVDSREAIICEGQIDVIRCHLAGFTTAVAAQGTAFTDDHARVLKRYADSVVLVFDADRAGQDAALRAADTFLQVGLAVKIAALPVGEDPDSMIRRKDGAAQFQQLIHNAQAAIDFQIDVLRAREAGNTEAGLLRITAAVLETIRRTPNAIQQARLLQQASARLGVPEDALRKEWQKLEKRARPESAPSEAKAGPSPTSKELALAEHLAADTSLTEWVRTYLPLDLISDALCRQMIQLCLEAVPSKRDLMSLVAERDNDARDLSRFAAQVLAAPSKVKGDMSTNEESVKSLILGIRTDSLRRRRKEIEKIRQTSLAGTGSRLDAEEDKKLELEHCQLGYDLARMKTWETAVPVMEIM